MYSIISVHERKVLGQIEDRKEAHSICDKMNYHLFMERIKVEAKTNRALRTLLEEGDYNEIDNLFYQEFKVDQIKKKEKEFVVINNDDVEAFIVGIQGV